MQKAALSVVIILECLLPVKSAVARNIYVNNVAGNDGSSGMNSQASDGNAGPVKTIAKALRLVQPGDRLVLAAAGQPYRESLSLGGSRHSASLGQPLVIEGNGAVLDGSAPVPPTVWEYCRGRVYRFRPPHVEFQQLFLGDRPAVRSAAGKPAAEPPKLEPLQWCLSGNHIYFAVENGKLPENYPLRFADKQTGITLYSVQGVVIQDLTVEGFQLDGINAFNSARPVHLLHVTCRNNGRCGVTVGGASQVDIESCDLSGNGLAQVLALRWSETFVWQSQLASAATPAWINRGGSLQIDGKEQKE